MEEEIKILLRKNLELTKENNRLLKKLRRATIISGLLRLVWWVVILGIPVFLYYYVLQPYLGELSAAYQNVQDGVGSMQDVVRGIPFIGEFFADMMPVEGSGAVAE